MIQSRKCLKTPIRHPWKPAEISAVRKNVSYVRDSMYSNSMYSTNSAPASSRRFSNVYIIHGSYQKDMVLTEPRDPWAISKCGHVVRMMEGKRRCLIQSLMTKETQNQPAVDLSSEEHADNLVEHLSRPHRGTLPKDGLGGNLVGRSATGDRDLDRTLPFFIEVKRISCPFRMVRGGNRHSARAA